MKNVYIAFFETQFATSKYCDELPPEEIPIMVFDNKLQAELFVERLNDSLISTGYYLGRCKHNQPAYYACGIIYLRHMIDDIYEFQTTHPDYLYVDTNGARIKLQTCPMWNYD